MSEKAIIDRLTNLEAKLDRLTELKNPVITEDRFRRFHTRVIESYSEMGLIPVRIIINEKYADDLKHKAVYLDDETGLWVLIRHTLEDSVPIAFLDIPRDWIVESVTGGYFS